MKESWWGWRQRGRMDPFAVVEVEEMLDFKSKEVRLTLIRDNTVLESRTCLRMNSWIMKTKLTRGGDLRLQTSLILSLLSLSCPQYNIQQGCRATHKDLEQRLQLWGQQICWCCSEVEYSKRIPFHRQNSSHTVMEKYKLSSILRYSREE